MTREGGCFCKAIRYRAEGDPRVVTHCHCLHCRGTSGAAFITWSEFPSERFEWTKGKPESFESRPGITRTFCGRCGTPLTYRGTSGGRTIDVTTCSFDRPETFEPRDHIWCRSLLPWVHLEDGLPQYPVKRAEG
ncbi:MAG TPA: GFA family protein [Verrucomicrobiae bacterium]|nr:GFA family protein [Verrucomicrobiae bacterium]